MHGRSQYAARTLTTSLPTRTVKQDLEFYPSTGLGILMMVLRETKHIGAAFISLIVFNNSTILYI